MKKTALASSLILLTLALTACGGGGSSSNPALANQNSNASANQNSNPSQQQNNSANNPINAKEVAEQAALPATEENALAKTAFNKGKLLFGGKDKPLAYKDFVSTDGNLKYYVLNFVQCHGPVCAETGEKEDRYATTGTLKFTIHYENDQWLAKNVTISHLARNNVDLVRYDNDHVVKNMATKSTDLAADGTKLKDGRLQMLDEKQRIFSLNLADDQVKGFSGLTAELHFSEHGGFVMSAAVSDLIIAGQRQPSNHSPVSSDLSGSWSGYQLKHQTPYLQKFSRLTDFTFGNRTSYNSSIKLFDGSTEREPRFSNTKGFGGYVAFGKSGAYMYGYATDSRTEFHSGNPIYANTGAFVVDPSQQFMVGTGGTGFNNLIGRDREQTFILQK